MSLTQCSLSLSSSAWLPDRSVPSCCRPNSSVLPSSLPDLFQLSSKSSKGGGSRRSSPVEASSSIFLCLLKRFSLYNLSLLHYNLHFNCVIFVQGVFFNRIPLNVQDPIDNPLKRFHSFSLLIEIIILILIVKCCTIYGVNYRNL